MPTTRCPSCQGKWEVVSGGLCAVCRTVDRLAATCRGPLLPASAGEALLSRVRTWIGEVQDLSETVRGVVPCARGLPPTHLDPAGPPEGGSVDDPPKEPEVAGAFPKAPPPPPPAVPLKEEGNHPEAGREASREPTTAQGSRPSPKVERTSRTPKKEKKKRARKSRSGRRSRRRSERRYASPVRPEGVKSESPSVDREELRRRKARPRSPSRSPERPPLPRAHRPSQRPVGSQWRGPIRAKPWEPPPGQGRHFQKNKGVGKRKRNSE